MTVVASKRLIRQQMRQRRAVLTPAQTIAFGKQFLNQLRTLRAYRRAQNIACYWPHWGELHTQPLIIHALQQNKSIFLPVVHANRMWFCRWDGNTSLPRNRQSGIVQPLIGNIRLVNKLHLDLVVVPLLAFDRRCQRLGQGGGYYDCYFSAHLQRLWRKPKLIGAAYDFQEIDAVPTQSWDVRLAGVVTNCEVIIRQSPRRTT